MKRSHVGLLLSACLVLAACGNRPGQSQLEVLRTAVSDVFKSSGQEDNGGATAEQIAAEIDAGLKGTDLPLSLAVVEARNSTTLLTRIETNGPHGTWAAPDRRTIIMKDGLITATRGLGNDIMSSETGEIAALVTARQEGQAQRVHRYLDGENHTVDMRATCRVTRGGEKMVESARFEAKAIEMTESCDTGARRFVNTYMVDTQGDVVQSRQWASPDTGHIFIQALRK
ncbi:MAG: Group 4 capsule polysaccharide formation lipoprotein gfcB [Rhodobacteraceae bacterium HLUCCO07]|nr:MAG: Group 4 capsule polysaccharide formation lipoprotein gfcB [Rhodobacteraceae bacterium HLUCCO07]